MKNITFSADPDLIERAREVAESEHKTLNVAFREWLESYSRKRDVEAFHAVLERLKHIDAGGPYAREEMNER